MNIFDTNIKEDFNYILNTIGKDIIYNEENKKALISDAQEKISYFDDKIIKCNFEIKTGDIIEYQNNKWVIISEIDITDNIYKARIRKSDYNIKMYIDDILCTFDTIIESENNFAIDSSNGLLDIATGNIEIVLPNTDISNKIHESIRLIKMKQAWKIMGVNRTKKGLIILNCKKDMMNANDDELNEIADRWTYEQQHHYSIEINNQDFNVSVEDTLQLDITVKDTVNNTTTIIENPNLTYKVDNTDIATITETGLINGIIEGTTTITVTFIDESNIKVTKDITIDIIKKVIIKEYVINCTDSGDDGSELVWFCSCEYQVQDLHSKEKSTNNYDFTIDYNGNNPKIVKQVTVIDNQTIEIKADNYDQIEGTIILRATNKADSSDILEKNIKIISW